MFPALVNLSSCERVCGKERERASSTGSKEITKPHAICIPVPAQGHINPMLKVAKILHSKGFDITFVNTEINHQRLLEAQGSDALQGIPSFRFESIPDGLSEPQSLPALWKSIDETCLAPFKRVIAKVGASYSPVTCIVSDLLMGFTNEAAKELGIPCVLLWTSGAGSLICADQVPNLIQKGLMPLKDSSYLTNGYLDTIVDFIPSLNGIRLKDISPLVRMINAGDDYLVEYTTTQLERAKTASGIIFNTFHELENDILDTLSSIFPPCYGIGPLHLHYNTVVDKSLASIKLDLWKEEPECLKWLDAKEPLSVIYVNFGSYPLLTSQQIIELCWGLAKSNYSFLWIIRPDFMIDNSSVLPKEFLEVTRDRGLLTRWCLQELVLNHPSIGGFFTHSGWNSSIESISSGVPMICWPFYADQQTNCWVSCNKWGIAMEVDNNVTSDEVTKLVIELMNGEKGKEMRNNVIDLRNKAVKACALPFGSSMVNLEQLIHLLKTSPK